MYLFIFRLNLINKQTNKVFQTIDMTASMSPCTIEKDVIDAMKKFRRLSNKATMAILCEGYFFLK